MRVRWTGMIATLLTVMILLGGCMRETNSETIIIPDIEDESLASGGNEPFDVKTIYRVLDQSQDNGNGIPLGWIDNGSLLSVFGERSNMSRLDRVDYPYESHLKWRAAEAKPEFMALSPNGLSLASLVQQGDGNYVLKLISIVNQQETDIGQLGKDQIRSVKLGWSNNGRYLIYLSRKAESGGDGIHVYDTTARSMKRYTVNGWKPTDTIVSVHIADDAQSVVIIKMIDRLAYVQFGTWRGNELVNTYEHLASRDSGVEWIHNDQIVFMGPEATLYAYDRRNSALSILLEQIGMFRLSPDRKAIVYSQSKDTLYAASLYGNNVLNKTQIFKGMVPNRMEWSPDNGKLLLSGWKMYEQDKPRPIEAAVIGIQNLVIEFK